MKFKIAVVSLLTAITLIFGYTGYVMSREAKNQTQLISKQITIAETQEKLLKEILEVTAISTTDELQEIIMRHLTNEDVTYYKLRAENADLTQQRIENILSQYDIESPIRTRFSTTAILPND